VFELSQLAAYVIACLPYDVPYMAIEFHLTDWLAIVLSSVLMVMAPSVSIERPHQINFVINLCVIWSS